MKRRPRRAIRIAQFGGLTVLVIASLLSLFGSTVSAQDWQARKGSSWTPDVEMLEAARMKLEAQFSEIRGDGQDFPPWAAYHLWYLALEPDGKRVILVLGSTRDEDLSDVVAIFGGGRSRFRAAYDVSERSIEYLLFNEDP